MTRRSGVFGAMALAACCCVALPEAVAAERELLVGAQDAARVPRLRPASRCQPHFGGASSLGVPPPRSDRLRSGYRYPLVLVIHGYTGTAETTETGDLLQPARRRARIRGGLPAGNRLRGGREDDHSWNDLACNASPGRGLDLHRRRRRLPDAARVRRAAGVRLVLVPRRRRVHRRTPRRARAHPLRRSRPGLRPLASATAHVVHRLGCDLPERFAAIAPVAGTLARGFNCAPPTSPGISMINIHAPATECAVRRDAGGRRFLYTPTAGHGRWAGKSSQQSIGRTAHTRTSRDGVNGFPACSERTASTGAEL